MQFSFMLPSKNRLPAFDIRNVMRRGRRISSGSVQLVVSSGAASGSRFAFIVSTSVDKRATRRNRMKRLLRESVQKKLEAVSQIDGVFIVKKGLPDTQAEVDKIVSSIMYQVL